MKRTPRGGVKQNLKPRVYKQWEGFKARPRTFCIMGWQVNVCGKAKRDSSRSRRETESDKGMSVVCVGPETGRSIHVQGEARVKPRGGPNPFRLKTVGMRCG